MGILLVTHDLGVVADFADDVAVMYAGHVVEYGMVRDVFHDARHPYARGLLNSMPQGATPRSQLSVVPGRVPMAGQFPSGCRFRARCPYADDQCLDPAMSLVEVAPLHRTRCVRVQRDEIELTPRLAGTAHDG